MSNEIQSDNPTVLHHMLVGMISLSKKSYVIIGKILYHLKQGDTWRSATGGYETWEDYLKQPEISMNKGDAARLMQIYETFCLKFELSEDTVGAVPVKSMNYLLPIVKKMDDKEKVAELTADATLLSQQDFKQRIAEHKGVEDETYEFFIMKRRVETNALHRVREISSEAIKEAFNL